jgi:diguanylate cyclase (GGDEF)-like protein
MKTNNNFHILIVDDEPFNIELAEIYLEEEGYQISSANGAQEAFEVIKKEKIDLILLDINMPKKNGFEVCQLLKADKKTKDIVVIFLTAQTDVKYISRAFEVGGVDYLSKPFFALELKARVKTQLQNIAFTQEVKLKQSKLAQLTITDPATKLYNSLYLDSQIKMYQIRKENFWIIYIKLNRFEKINQLYGYSTANKIIKKFAHIVQDEAYKSSIVSRVYGINFAILLKDYDINSVKTLYESLYKRVANDKDLGKVLSFSTILYKVGDHTLSLPVIYKNIELNMQKIQDGNTDRHLFIN